MLKRQYDNLRQSVICQMNLQCEELKVEQEELQLTCLKLMQTCNTIIRLTW